MKKCIHNAIGTIIHVKESFTEVWTPPDNSKFENQDTIEAAQKYVCGLSSDSLLFPNQQSNPQTMFMDWIVDLDNMIFNEDWLSTNPELSIKS